jgi:hypothetical protein
MMSARKKRPPHFRIGRLLVGGAPAMALRLAEAPLTAPDLVFLIC